MTAHQFCEEKTLAFERQRSLQPQRLLTGRDLEAFGFAPGPLYRTIFQLVETEQLEGRLHTREQALDFVKNAYRWG
mgnify:FL=1